MSQENPFQWRHCQPDVILLGVRWYLRYPISYRDLEEMMVDRGLKVDHTTLNHWVASAEDAAAHKQTAHYAAWRDTVANWMGDPRKDLPFKGLFPGR